MSHRLLDDFKGFLSYDLSDSTKDDALSLALGASESALYSVYGIELESKNKTEVFDGEGTSYYLLSEGVTSIVSLTVDSVVIELTDIYIKNGYLKLKTGTITSGIQNCTLVYSVGYADAELPENLKMALFKLANKLFSDTEESRDGISNYTTGTKVGTDYIAKHLPDTFEFLVQPYKKIFV